MDLASALRRDELHYRGFVISHPSVRMTSAWFEVNLGSESPHLFNRIGGRIEIYQDPDSLEGAIEQAKRRVDQVLGSP
jgi:hypothetical protein